MINQSSFGWFRNFHWDLTRGCCCCCFCCCFFCLFRASFFIPITFVRRFKIVTVSFVAAIPKIHNKEKWMGRSRTINLKMFISPIVIWFSMAYDFHHAIFYCCHFAKTSHPIAFKLIDCIFQMICSWFLGSEGGQFFVIFVFWRCGT